MQAASAALAAKPKGLDLESGSLGSGAGSSWVAVLVGLKIIDVAGLTCRMFNAVMIFMIFIYIYTYIYTYINVFMHGYIYIYTYTYAWIYTYELFLNQRSGC